MLIRYNPDPDCVDDYQWLSHSEKIDDLLYELNNRQRFYINEEASIRNRFDHYYNWFGGFYDLAYGDLSTNDAQWIRKLFMIDVNLKTNKKTTDLIANLNRFSKKLQAFQKKHIDLFDNFYTISVLGRAALCYGVSPDFTDQKIIKEFLDLLVEYRDYVEQATHYPNLLFQFSKGRILAPMYYFSPENSLYEYKKAITLMWLNQKLDQDHLKLLEPYKIC